MVAAAAIGSSGSIFSEKPATLRHRERRTNFFALDRDTVNSEAAGPASRRRFARCHLRLCQTKNWGSRRDPQRELRASTPVDKRAKTCVARFNPQLAIGDSRREGQRGRHFLIGRRFRQAPTRP